MSFCSFSERSPAKDGTPSAFSQTRPSPISMWENMSVSSALRRVLENRHARVAPKSPDDLVFQTVKGTPLSDKNLYNRELAPACDRIKQPRISWHSFRHTHATLLYANGESLKTAQALLGHSDLETTLNVYTHTISDSQRNAVERVAGVLFGVLDSVGLNSAPAATPGARPN